MVYWWFVVLGVFFFFVKGYSGYWVYGGVVVLEICIIDRCNGVD